MWSSKLIKAAALLATTSLVSGVHGTQHPFTDTSFPSNHAANLGLVATFANGSTASVLPSGGLDPASLETEEYTTLKHDHHRGHQVRIKKSHFCDPTVKHVYVNFSLGCSLSDRCLCSVYTGYLDVDDGAKHLFFYYFESRRDPSSDDVQLVGDPHSQTIAFVI
jgi:hypothetical protein